MNIGLIIRQLNNPYNVNLSRKVSYILIICEAILCYFIIKRVPYTEIDWTTYMEQVSLFLKGERDYANIKGSTGPLVYPAGFLYIHVFLKWITVNGNVLNAQIIFAFIYLITQYLVFDLYINSSSVPPWALILLTLSKRIHSIYTLRLFNDCITMLFVYIALVLLSRSKTSFSIVMFSLAVSIKMNVLIMAPPVLAYVLSKFKIEEIVLGVFLGLCTQLILANEFLRAAPVSYLMKAFEFTRQFYFLDKIINNGFYYFEKVFEYKWTVNLKFLPESVFLSRELSITLLAMHVFSILWLIFVIWPKSAYNVNYKARTKNTAQLQSFEIKSMLWLIFTGNFIGIIFSRSLHYQFYSWYFHTLPFLLWQSKLNVIFKLVLFFTIEICWNVYPSTFNSSLVLMACHLVIYLSFMVFYNKPVLNYHKLNE